MWGGKGPGGKIKRTRGKNRHKHKRRSRKNVQTTMKRNKKKEMTFAKRLWLWGGMKGTGQKIRAKIQKKRKEKEQH